MSSLTCSPKVSTDNISTCYTLPQLKKIAANYNNSHNDKINLILISIVLFITCFSELTVRFWFYHLQYS